MPKPATCDAKVLNEAISWYAGARPLYESLVVSLERILDAVLRAEQIPCHSVGGRAKSEQSFAKKAFRYGDPREEIEDLAAVRIIAYVESDVRRIADIIPKVFAIVPEHSGDKSSDLGVDRVGYRSVHFIATLPAVRTQLPDYARFSGMKFEVQIRTILQHGWAEVEHDRNYKFAGVLPEELRRRFSLLAGLLELADGEFDRIAREIDRYTAAMKQEADAGNLDIGLDSITLKEFLSRKLARVVEMGIVEPVIGAADIGAGIIIRELNDYGITSIRELDAILPAGFVERYAEHYPATSPTNFMGLLRDAMLIHDIERYFKKSYKGTWHTLGQECYALYRSYDLDPAVIDSRLARGGNDY